MELTSHRVRLDPTVSPVCFPLFTPAFHARTTPYTYLFNDEWMPAVNALSTLLYARTASRFHLEVCIWPKRGGEAGRKGKKN